MVRGRRMRTELSDDLQSALDVGARGAEVGDAGPERQAAVYGAFDKWPVPRAGATAAPPPPAARRDLPLKPLRELAAAVNAVAQRRRPRGRPAVFGFPRS
jgi:hypothetical protein